MRHTIQILWNMLTLKLKNYDDFTLFCCREWMITLFSDWPLSWVWRPCLRCSCEGDKKPSLLTDTVPPTGQERECLGVTYITCVIYTLYVWQVPLYVHGCSTWHHSDTSWWICFMQTHSFCLLQMLTDGLECCGLLWCFYQLFGLSFWRHPFTAEHPLLRQWCRDTFLQIWWRNKLILISDDLRVSTFSAN